MTRQRVGEIVRHAATLASTRLAVRELAALSKTSPHTLRRTYISIALVANHFDVLWVMRQVGHADSHMTMDVYAQLQQRAERQHGEAFDGLVRQARDRLYGTVEEADERDDGSPTPMGRPARTCAWRIGEQHR
jgi:integrase